MPAREALVRSFFDALNRGDREACAAVLTESCVYVDAQGMELRGAEACARFAAGLKRIDPDYRIDLASAVRRNDDVLVRGTVHSNYERFAGETMWRVTVAGNRIARFEATSGRFASLIRAVRSIDPGSDSG